MGVVGQSWGNLQALCYSPGMEAITPPSQKASAIWYLWASAFNVLIALSPRWIDDEEPYAVVFGEKSLEGEFVRLSEVEAQWLMDMKYRSKNE